MPETYTLQDWIISIAMHDQAFREELVRNPKETLERELGSVFPKKSKLIGSRPSLHLFPGCSSYLERLLS